MSQSKPMGLDTSLPLVTSSTVKGETSLNAFFRTHCHPCNRCRRDRSPNNRSPEAQFAGRTFPPKRDHGTMVPPDERWGSVSSIKPAISFSKSVRIPFGLERYRSRNRTVFELKVLNLGEGCYLSVVCRIPHTRHGIDVNSSVSTMNCRV